MVNLNLLSLDLLLTDLLQHNRHLCFYHYYLSDDIGCVDDETSDVNIVVVNGFFVIVNDASFGERV